MNGRSHIEDSLRRIEGLVHGLEKIQDPASRAAARQLFEAILDLHGLALAKIAARLSASEAGRETYAALGRDEQAKAVLLLHGLHPQSAEERVREAIPALEERLGVAIRLTIVADGIARLTLQAGDKDWDYLCREIGRALIDAAPDLDDIAIDHFEATVGVVQDEPLAAAAG